MADQLAHFDGENGIRSERFAGGIDPRGRPAKRVRGAQQTGQQIVGFREGGKQLARIIHFVRLGEYAKPCSR